MTAAERFRTVERSGLVPGAEGLEFVTVKSRALGQRADVTLFVPPSAEHVVDLPVVMLLHGVYGSHWAWALKGRAHLTAARLIASRDLPPVALLMPSDGLWGDGSGYVPHLAQDFEAWLVEEMPALAVEAVEACTPASPILIAGLSMGGFAALRLAGKYPDRFAAASAHSALTDAGDLDALIEETRDAWSTNPADMTVVDALIGARRPLPPIRFDCGTEDPFLAANRGLHRALSEEGIGHLYVERPGGHDWSYWSTEIEESFRFFGHVLRGGSASNREKQG